MTDLPNLPRLGIKVAVFDLDGVITDTAHTHMAAWKRLFDQFLEDRDGPAYAPFTNQDYMQTVDGKPRLKGIRSFLESRDINEDEETIQDLGARKNRIFNEMLEADGVVVYGKAVAYVEWLLSKGLRTAMVSSSKNCGPILERAGLRHLFEVMVDGHYAAEHRLPGKPHPDTFIRGAELLGATPRESVVFEDAIAGVRAGAAGSFKFTIGVDRGAGRQALLDNGADFVIGSFGEFDLE